MNTKIALVTGGTMGIGLATSIKLAQSGCKVFACGRNEVEFDNDRIEYRYLDVTDVTSCKILFDNIASEFGRIDILIANAGITDDALTSKMTDHQFEKVMDVNVKGIFNIVRLVGPYMERQGYGSIVCVSSIVGEQGNIGQANYAASKGAIIAMMKTWAKEFSRKGANVRVNAVAPGYTLTRMMDTVPDVLLQKFASQTMLKRLGNPEEIAAVINFLASDDSSYVTGTVVDVNGGLSL